MQEIPSVLSAATRLVFLDISENELILTANELHMLSVLLQPHSHLDFSGLKVCCNLCQH